MFYEVFFFRSLFTPFPISTRISYDRITKPQKLQPSLHRHVIKRQCFNLNFIGSDRPRWSRSTYSSRPFGPIATKAAKPSSRIPAQVLDWHDKSRCLNEDPEIKPFRYPRSH